MTYRAKPADGVAWVTGASSGIGRETARELARRGYRVAVTARRLDELEALAQELAQDLALELPQESAGGAASPAGGIIAHAGDVTDASRMAEIVDAVERLHGPIALAFLNAGTFFAGEERAVFDMASIKKTLDVNLMGAVHCLGPLIARMVERGRGQIAINGSVAGYGGLPNAAAYGASKAALIHLAESLKFSLDPAGITMQIVNPGFVDTPLTAKNPFPMPFLMPSEEAVKRICDGFERGGFEITFPRRLAWTLKLVNLLPYALYFPLLARATGGRGKVISKPPR